jgi:hypothetical protein
VNNCFSAESGKGNICYFIITVLPVIAIFDFIIQRSSKKFGCNFVMKRRNDNVGGKPGRLTRSRGVSLGEMESLLLQERSKQAKIIPATTSKSSGNKNNTNSKGSLKKKKSTNDSLGPAIKGGSQVHSSREITNIRDVNIIPEETTPFDWAKLESSSSGFRSCLNVEDDFGDSPKGMRPILLRRAVSIRELDDDSWLSSTLIDLVISKFSRIYLDTHFMSIDFVVLSLSGLNSGSSSSSSSHGSSSITPIDKSALEQATDMSGRRINYDTKVITTNNTNGANDAKMNTATPGKNKNNDNDKLKSIVFVCNSNNIHWNLIRVVRSPSPEIQLFEPMGKPVNRHGGLGYRDVPRCVIRWLDICCPLDTGDSWITRGVSAITTQQQFTPFDCGVACLLYAEKCGRGQSGVEINTNTSQRDITEYRKVLQEFTRDNLN